MTGWQVQLTYYTFFVGFSLILGGCEDSQTSDCKGLEATGQCVAAQELWAALATDSIENTSGADCPSISQLNRSAPTAPSEFELSGSHWESGPEKITADGQCCYTTTDYCM
jgi:hypothetical protein